MCSLSLGRINGKHTLARSLSIPGLSLIIFSFSWVKVGAPSHFLRLYMHTTWSWWGRGKVKTEKFQFVNPTLEYVSENSPCRVIPTFIFVESFFQGFYINWVMKEMNFCYDEIEEEYLGNIFIKARRRYRQTLLQIEFIGGGRREIFFEIENLFCI